MLEYQDREFDKEYAQIVKLRRSLEIKGFKNLKDVGMEGPWVTPYQKISCCPHGPIFLAKSWFDEKSILRHNDTLSRLGYLPDLQFNKVIDKALSLTPIKRSDIYLTQVFLSIPANGEHKPSARQYEESFEKVTQHELRLLTAYRKRKVIALGRKAQELCGKFSIGFIGVTSPSAYKGSHDHKAQEIVEAIEESSL